MPTNITFYADRAAYRYSRSKLEVLFDQAILPLSWDSTWNQCKHLLGAKVGVKAVLVRSGKCQHRAGEWHLVEWEAAVPSRIEVQLPANIEKQIAEARSTHHCFGQCAEALDRLRQRIQSVPLERADLQKLCAAFGIPHDFDVALITWRPDYDAFYYRQLSNRARRLYVFRSEYIFDLEQAVVAETPQLGHATYVFSKPASMTDFLVLYSHGTKDDIRYNRSNIAEKLAFQTRLIHGTNPQVWLKELKARLGETTEYIELPD